MTSKDGIVFSSVCKTFGNVRAVDNFDLTIKPGKATCILGPSGCGKTTVLRLAAGLERCQKGSISIDGQVVDDHGVFISAEKREVGLVFQDFALFPHLTVLQNVLFGIKRNNDSYIAANQMLESLGMSSYAQNFPHTLSGGEQQRVALARALVTNPKVMLLDEPFSDLDLRLRNRVGDESLSLLKKFGTSVLLVTHDSEEAMRLADNIVLMRKGRIVQQGKSVELYNSPIDVNSARIFSEINILSGIVKSESIETAFGKIPTSKFKDGAHVSVVIRPELITVSSHKSPHNAYIVNVKFMGSWTHVELKPFNNDTTLIARMDISDTFFEGEAVNLEISTDSVSVFNKEY